MSKALKPTAKDREAEQAPAYAATSEPPSVPSAIRLSSSHDVVRELGDIRAAPLCQRE